MDLVINYVLIERRFEKYSYYVTLEESNLDLLVIYIDVYAFDKCHNRCIAKWLEKKWLMRIKGHQWASFVHNRERFPWVKNFSKGYLWMPSLIKENVQKDVGHNERQLDV